jgi:hypothetical protein
MAAEGNGQPIAYQLSMSGQVSAGVAEVREQAADIGLLDEFDAAYGAIEQRLQADPLGLGELVKALKHMKLLIHVGVVQPLIVRFAIDEERRIVYLMDVTLL